MDFSATDAAQLTGLTRKTVTSIFLKIRQRIAQACERDSPLLTGEITLDENHPEVIRAGRGRLSSSRTPVFGLLKRNGKVYTEMVPDAAKATCQAVIRGRIAPAEALAHNGGWRGYDGLVDVGYSKHLRISHDTDQCVRSGNQIDGIESFWSFAKRRLQKFNGVAPHTFYLHLKECEWRFNMRHRDLYVELLKLLRKHPL